MFESVLSVAGRQVEADPATLHLGGQNLSSTVLGKKRVDLPVHPLSSAEVMTD